MAMTGSKELFEKLDTFSQFRLHTGNINEYSQLKIKRFTDSAAELQACLQLQLQNSPNVSSFGNDGTLLLCNNSNIGNYERQDLKITMKVFLSSWNLSEVKEAVTCLLEQLKTDDLELLILATPEIEVVEGESEEEETKRWMKMIEPIWSYAESLVEQKLIVSLGVADLNVGQLSSLCANADVKPCVNHVRLDGCCVVPAELSEFAKDHDIQLLTHNDPQPFPTSQVFNTFCDLQQSSPFCASKFAPTWAARYTVWVRRRSVMASKGYIVQLKKINENIN